MSSFVKLNITLPDEEDFRIYLQSILNAHAAAINQRDIAIYDTAENPTGQLWPNPSVSPDATNTTYRVFVPVTLSAYPAPNVFPHGLDIKGYVFTLITGTICNRVNRALAIPYPGTDQVLLDVNATDVIIQCSTNAFDGFVGEVVLEYLKLV